MEAIVLAGGLGTRLREVVKDIPKPMAPVNNKPFLEYILKYLKVQGIKKVVLAVGYKWEVIRDYFGTEYEGITLEYSVEEEQLGTGGAIKQALEKCADDNVFIINGDTYFNVDLRSMLRHHEQVKANLTIATKRMYEFERYGKIECKNNRIVKFEEKRFNVEGNINGGIYICERTLLDLGQKIKFSFEKDIMERFVNERYFSAFESDAYFMDIGIPEDYKQFQLDFQSEQR